MKPKTIIFSTRAICDPTTYIWQGHKEILKRFGIKLTEKEIEMAYKLFIKMGDDTL